MGHVALFDARRTNAKKTHFAACSPLILLTMIGRRNLQWAREAGEKDSMGLENWQQEPHGSSSSSCGSIRGDGPHPNSLFPPLMAQMKLLFSLLSRS